MSSASDIADAAAAWLIRLEGQTRPEIWDEFQSWLDHCPRHRAAFIRLRVAWNRVDVLKNLRPADGTIDADLLARERVSSAITHSSEPLQPVAARGIPAANWRAGRRRGVLAFGAALAAGAVFAWFAAGQQGWQSFQTGLGQHQQIQLADGSRVDLNTNTRLRVRMTRARRELVLVSGEALFHVAHDSARPFVVSADGTIVRAVGTAFSIRLRGGQQSEVMVEEGIVAIGPPGKDTNFDNPTALAAATRVSADQDATVRPDRVELRLLPRDSVRKKLQWTNGILDFRGETLADAVAEFNRYNRRQIAIADPAIRGLRMGGGNFNPTDIDSFVGAVQRLFGLRAEVVDGNVRLSASGEDF